MERETVDPRVGRTQRDVVQAATEILLEDGLSAITHAEVARRAGYAKATIYNHWPTQVDLIRSAVDHLCEAHDHPTTLTSDLRADLVGELLAFTNTLTKGRLAPALGGLVERAGTDPAIPALLNQMHQHGSRVLYTILRAHLIARDVEPTAVLLSGAVFYRAAFQARTPTRQFIEDIVDRALATTERLPAKP